LMLCHAGLWIVVKWRGKAEGKVEELLDFP
jgi:hypothetical protein